MTLTPRALSYYVAEYPSVLRRAAAEGWLDSLVKAHLIPCDKEEANFLLCGLPLPADLHLLWHNRAGRARYNPKTRRYGISLPGMPGTGRGRLRIALVLHEAAHIMDHEDRKQFGHGQEFCTVFRELLKHWQRTWRTMTPEDFSEIYDRHPGPYSLLLTRRINGKKQQAEIKGPFLAGAAHREALRLIAEPDDRPVTDIYVYSEKEHLFIGASYYRGKDYVPFKEYVDGDGRVERQPKRNGPTLLSEGPEPVPAAAGPVEADHVPSEGLAVDSLVPTVHAKAPRREPTKRPGDRFPTVRGKSLELDGGNAEAWPKSQPAQAVRTWFEEPGRKATAAEAAQALAAQLKEMGMDHPVALISRLKQAGFLREVQELS